MVVANDLFLIYREIALIENDEIQEGLHTRILLQAMDAQYLVRNRKQSTPSSSKNIQLC